MGSKDKTGDGKPAFKGVLVAFLGAALITVTTVLPVEYGIDITGFGKLSGLLRNKKTPTLELNDFVAPVKNAILIQDTPLQTLNRTIVLEEYEGIEFKLDLAEQQAINFHWHSSGPIFSDMHAEPYDAAPNEFVTYWKEKEQSGGQGTLITSFAGHHGWYWQNMGEDTITIDIVITGFFDEKLIDVTTK